MTKLNLFAVRVLEGADPGQVLVTCQSAIHRNGNQELVKPTKPIPSIDIYATYRCNLRCSHCFVGPKLAEATHFDFELLQTLIKTVPSWGTKEITFLGGEPSLYPHLPQAIRMVQDNRMQARIVTNGQKPFERFMDAFEGSDLPHICFSIDGSSSDVHDAIRGRGTFDRLIHSISIANKKGYTTSGIISLARSNADDCERLLDLSAELGFQYVNIHYVTNRGFATEKSVLSIDEWLAIVRRIEVRSESIELDVRVERTFTPQKEASGGCAVREESNLMFFPDGRVFMCAMFIDIENAHSYTWTSKGLVPNQSGVSEKKVCEKETPVHCPAIALVNPNVYDQAQKQGKAVRCIYDKSCLRLGREKVDTHSMHLRK
jgi:MoaA/NifB/PqqE/SkfB family radical SAM enzyme